MHSTEFYASVTSFYIFITWTVCMCTVWIPILLFTAVCWWRPSVTISVSAKTLCSSHSNCGRRYSIDCTRYWSVADLQSRLPLVLSTSSLPYTREALHFEDGNKSIGQRLLKARPATTSAEELSGLLKQNFYWPGALPVVQLTVSKHCSINQSIIIFRVA